MEARYGTSKSGIQEGVKTEGENQTSVHVHTARRKLREDNDVSSSAGHVERVESQGLGLIPLETGVAHTRDVGLRVTPVIQP